MTMNRIFCICLIACLMNFSSCNETNKSNLIKIIGRFLKQLNQPLRITTSTLCWRKEDFFLLTKSLIKHNFLTTPSKGNLTTYWPHEQQLFLIDLQCEDSYDVLNLASDLNLLDYPFKWLILHESNSTSLPKNLNIFVRSKVYIINSDRDGYKIISKYRVSTTSSEYLTNDIATWNNNSFKYFNKLIDPRNRTNLMKEAVNVSYVITDPITNDHLLDGKDKHVDPSIKVNFPITMHVLDAINGTPFFILRNTWGYKYPNDTKFSGMMGDAQNNIADLLSSPVFYILERMPYIDAIAATTPGKTRFVFRAPPLSYVQNIYSLPFDTKVWFASAVIIFVLMLAFYLISYCESNNNSLDSNVNNGVPLLEPIASDVIQLHIGAICQQGSEAEPVSLAGRIATIFLFVFMLFLYTSYSANIVGLLQSTTDSIKTLDDLLQSKIKLGVEDTPFNRFFFTAQSGKTQQAIYREKVAPPGKPGNFLELRVGVKKIREEYFGFHTETTSIYKVVSDTFQEHEKCGLKEIPYFTAYTPYYSIRKNTTYGELFRSALRKMTEAGITYRNFNRIYLKKPPCANQGNFLSVSLTDCYVAYLIFAIGVGIAVVMVIFEKLYFHRQFIKSKFK